MPDPDPSAPPPPDAAAETAPATAPPEPPPAPPAAEDSPAESFAAMLSSFEAEAPAHAEPKAGDRLTGRVVNMTADALLVDIGAKAEGVLQLEAVRGEDGSVPVAVGDPIEVWIEGRDAEGNFKLSPLTPDRPRTLEDLQAAFEAGVIIRAKVTGIVKGGFSVQAGERGFLPQSRSGVRDTAEMHKLVGQEIRCRLVRAPQAKNIVVDRRSVLEQEEQEAEAAALERLHEGDEVTATVRSLATYGAFVDLGGIDALLHVGDMSWSHLADPGKKVAIGDQVQVKVLKIDLAKKRLSVGMKQLTPDPWAGVTEKYPVGKRVRGVVQRTAEFGAFVELEPGIEGLIHISEMSWSRRVRKPEDVVHPSEVVEAVVLGVQAGQRRISLGLKQALGDPWADAAEKYAPGTVVEGRVRNLQPFGAFVEVAEGVDGMIHIGDLAEARLNHPSEVVKVGETVRVQVLELELDKRRLRLGMKQLAPTPADEYIASHQVGDVVSGRVLRAYPGRVELGERIEAACPSAAAPVRRVEHGTLGAKLAAVWKPPVSAEPEPAPTGVQLKAGELRKFRLSRLDAEHKSIEVEPV
ncbi:MAG: S1 RNA-binding domain-containing protein [Terriglobales bacterium]